MRTPPEQGRGQRPADHAAGGTPQPGRVPPPQETSGGGGAREPRPVADPDGAAAPAPTALPRLHRAVLVSATGAAALAVALHMGATFLHVAPENVLRQEHGPAIRGYLNPEFRQAWNLFAPELPTTDVTLHARATVRDATGEVTTTPWTDVSAPDLAELSSGPLPSRGRHQLRKLWNDIRALGAEDGRVTGHRADDLRAATARIALDRIALPDGEVESIQFRTVTTPIPPPPWASVQPGGEPVVSEHDSWPLPVGRTSDAGENRGSAPQPEAGR
ncbi:DUF5819 family protein [Streptomyces spiramenti]|uniref:Uncharacterized protein n=1 Tax=Streptomyces spiramenti TaxID=2720606 RepID=A0ABX1AFN7_9ACTN|nr:DUF5819 family protein [Streptomyces spiramenti]NJP64771.1 hypothetical protein [Streptomyces spiramenti]